MKNSLIFVFFLVVKLSFAQDADSVLYNSVAKNLICYQIANAKSYYLSQDVIPNYGYALDLTFKKLDNIKLSDSTFQIYLFNYFPNHFKGVCDKQMNYSIMLGGGLLSLNGLVAMRENGNSVIFLSGEMYLSDIHYFWHKTDIMRANNLSDYIKIKYFNYEPKDIFISLKKSFVVFYSEVLQEKIKVEFKLIGTEGELRRYKEIIHKK